MIMLISPNPGIIPLTAHLLNQVRDDKNNGLWSSKTDTDFQTITPEILTDLFDKEFSQNPFETNFFSLARKAYDFSILAMLAIQTEQWDRKDLHSSLLTLQGKCISVLEETHTNNISKYNKKIAKS